MNNYKSNLQAEVISYTSGLCKQRVPHQQKVAQAKLRHCRKLVKYLARSIRG